MKSRNPWKETKRAIAKLLLVAFVLFVVTYAVSRVILAALEERTRIENQRKEDLKHDHINWAL